MKTIISVPDRNIDNYIDKVDGIILGIKDLSIGFSTYYDIPELEVTVRNILSKGKEVFISLNKNIYNRDLTYLINTLKLLSNMNVSGVIYYDISIYNLVKENNLSINLYWSQEHLTTNYHTCNFWFKRGVCGTVLSNDITVDEIVEIRKNTNMKLMVMAFGYIKMMASSRKLVSNYLSYLNKDKKDLPYSIYEKVSGKEYPIIEDNNGTITLTSSVVNGIKYLDIFENNGIDYLFLDGLNISNFIDIIDAYNKKNFSYFNEIDDYFFSKKTVYKVKK